jgi:hypothetical protein
MDRWLCSLDDYHPGVGPSLCDQPLSSFPPDVPEEISPEEFEQAWKVAVQYRQEHSGEQSAD